MKQDENPSFFDIRTIITVVLIGIVFVGWQTYLQNKYPEAYKKKAEQTAPDAASAPGATAGAPGDGPSTVKGGPAEIAGAKTGKGDPSLVTAEKPESLVRFRADNVEFDISSKGMGLKNIKILNYKDRKGEVIQLAHPSEQILPLETRLLGRPEALDFTIEKVNDTLYLGRAKVGGLTVTKAMEVVPDKYLLQYKVSASGADPRFVGLTTALTETVVNPGGGSFFMPQVEFQEFFIETADTQDRHHLPAEDEQKSWSKVKVASIGSQYFTQAMVDRSGVMPEAKAQVTHANKAAQLILQYPVLNPGQDFQLEYSAFVGPKSYSLLRSIDANLAAVVDFGFFNWIARQIFAMLHWFHGLVGNWGIAIILLTVVVRILVLPFNIYSYKSMKAMQVIQPKIQALKERFKDDQQKQQQEMMSLMRENKVNPLGGCLPVFLQMPIFFALYQVLGHSIELYQAPLGLWIPDLSLKDPYYILPVLMGITMFFQQKMTPTGTMDPAQAKVLLMMPVIFTFFMISLPSGLTLYMLVGAVFSVAQQAYFMNAHKTPSEGGT